MRSLNQRANLPILTFMDRPRKRPSQQPKADKTTYRGVILRKPATASRFTSREIKRAVEHALAKHADDLKQSS
jgi:hypothetical protein